VTLAGLVVTTAVSLLPRLTSTPRGVEDSWQSNAAEVAHELDVVVARHKPERSSSQATRRRFRRCWNMPVAT